MEAVSKERRLGNWLQAYAEYTEGTESPPTFHLWVGIGTIAAAAQRKLYLERDYYQVHSNMYIVLVSPPGRSRKSTALRIGKDILKGVTKYGQEINFSTQASTVAALVKQLSAIKTKEHQSLTSFSSELGSMLGSKSVEMSDFLTDIYDCNPDWDKQTISRGLEKVERPWFNLIGATTPQWMGDNLSSTALEGGFIARCVFIFEDQRLLVAFPEMTEYQKEIRTHLMHDLAQIAALKGAFQFSPDARAYYKDWYENRNKATIEDPRLGGYYERRHVQVEKLSMIISLSENNSKIIEIADIEAAIMMLEEIEPGMHRAFSAVGKNVHSTDLERIKAQIIGAGDAGITYKHLFAGNIHSIDKRTFDDILLSLLTMGIVDSNASPRGQIFTPLIKGVGYANRNDRRANESTERRAEHGIANGATPAITPGVNPERDDTAGLPEG